MSGWGSEGDEQGMAVFVYPGLDVPHSATPESLGSAKLRGRLVGVPYGRGLILDAFAGKVSGEVFWMSPELVAEIDRRLDVRPGWFERRCHRVVQSGSDRVPGEVWAWQWMSDYAKPPTQISWMAAAVPLGLGLYFAAIVGAMLGAGSHLSDERFDLAWDGAAIYFFAGPTVATVLLIVARQRKEPARRLRAVVWGVTILWWGVICWILLLIVISLIRGGP